MSSRSSLMFLSVNGTARSYGTAQDVPPTSSERTRNRRLRPLFLGREDARPGERLGQVGVRRLESFTRSANVT
jgi:hypothetical protein